VKSWSHYLETLIAVVLRLGFIARMPHYAKYSHY